jgi:hypothetical protein
MGSLSLTRKAGIVDSLLLATKVTKSSSDDTLPTIADTHYTFSRIVGFPLCSKANAVGYSYSLRFAHSFEILLTAL